MDQRVAIIGAGGALGAGLLLRWERAGVDVLGADYADAAEVDVVVLCVPFRSQSEALTNLGPHLRAGQILVDTTVPLAAAVSGKGTRTLGVWQGSAAQQAAEMVPDGVHVVAALHTVSAVRLRDPECVLDEDVLVCGDDAGAKATAMALVDRIDGFRAVDAGPLEQARIAEQLKALLIGIDARNRAQTGVRIVGLK
jgi:NADPH-dependent F420 reductase